MPNIKPTLSAGPTNGSIAGWPVLPELSQPIARSGMFPLLPSLNFTHRLHLLPELSSVLLLTRH